MVALDVKAAQYQQQVLADWATDETASAWQKHYPRMTSQLAGVTRALIEAADPRPGMRVLDLASGPGEPALSLARGVAPDGEVVATDFSPHMLSALRTNAAALGLTNIQMLVADAQELPFGEAEFDLVTSRFGPMFFIDIQKALGHVYRTLKPGGRVAFAVWGPSVPGTYFADTVGPFVRRLATPLDPDGPGPMRFAETGKLANELEASGFEQIEEQIRSIPAAWQGSPEDLLSSVQEIASPFRKIVESLSDEDRQAAYHEAIESMRPRFDGSQVHTQAPILILKARKPAG